MAFGREPYEHRRFRNQAAKQSGARVGITVRQTLFSLVVNMTTSLGTAAVLSYGGYRVLQHELTKGELLLVIMYLAKVYQPLESISYSIGSLQDKFVNLKMAFEVFDSGPEVREPARPKIIDRAAGHIAFEGIDFAYAGRTDTLRDISFEIEPGKTVAIVGPTGAGKQDDAHQPHSALLRRSARPHPARRR